MNRKYLNLAAFVLVCSLALGFTLAGCSDDEVGGNSYSDGNGGGVNNHGDRVYFIKMAENTEASGTLYYIPVGSTKVVACSNKNMTSFYLNKAGTKIVFSEILSGYSGTYIGFMNIDGKEYQQTNISGSNPCFGSDENIVYFDDGGNVYSMKIDGTEKQVINIPGVDGTKRFPRISPDGKKLAFYQTSPGSRWYYDDVVYLYIYDLDTNQVTKLNNNSIPVSYLNWSPDGTIIAFSTTTGITPQVYELWVVETDGTSQPEQISDNGSPATGACGFPSFTKDGSILCGSTKNKKLNYRSSWDGDHYMYELATIEADGLSLTTILLPGYSIKNPLANW